MAEIVRMYKDKDHHTNTLSRYRNLYRILDSDGYEYIESANPRRIKETPEDSFHCVQSGEENRLDLISYRYYNTPLLYWVIAEANGIFNPTKIEAGVVLRIPSLSAIYGHKGAIM